MGYTPAGAATPANDLYRSAASGALAVDQSGTVLGEWKRFLAGPLNYHGHTQPDCTALPFNELWDAHASHRLDPKYRLFKVEAGRPVPAGWVRDRLGNVLQRRKQPGSFDSDPNQLFTVLTIAQTGEIRARKAGKGRNPPEWRASYFEQSPAKWYAVRAGDVVFSSIDLWKGCIALVPDDFDGSLVTNEFPIYRVRDSRLSASFLQALLRSRYYRRAFRAITTGHSNRRRTQVSDFEDLEIMFPEDRSEQERLIAGIVAARTQQQSATATLTASLGQFNDVIDARGAEEIPAVDSDANDGN